MMEVMIRSIPTSAPAQKARMTARTPWFMPRNQPIPSASLASPSPIKRPFEKSHKRKKGRNNNGPEIMAMALGV